MSINSERVINWRKKTKEKIIISMGGRCEICHYDKCPSALDLHHIDPNEKDFTLGSIRANPKSSAKIREELKKCVLLCANCHREVHAGVAAIPDNHHGFNIEIFDYENSSIQRLKEERRKEFKKEKLWNRKIFISNEELARQLETKYYGNKSLMARDFGVSEAAIRKRLKIWESFTHQLN